MESIDLSGAWQVRPAPLTCIGDEGLREIQAAQDGWIPAQVPGDVHLDLIRAGRMPEPTVGANMPECRWPEAHSWWYRKTFDLTEEFLKHELQELTFEGLDLHAQVFLNGALVHECANAFIPNTANAKPFLEAGANELVVRLTAGSELAKDETPPGQGAEHRTNSAEQGGIPSPMREGEIYAHRGWHGKKWLRKPQFSYGWDWVDSLPNIGIWRGVRLEGRSHAVIRDLRLDTMRHGDAADAVYVEMEAVVENLHPWSERVCVLDLSIQPPSGSAPIERQYSVTAQPGGNPIRDFIEVPDAQLWWPNGMGEQPLYQVLAGIADPDGNVCDRKALTIGLRTVEIDRTSLADGSLFRFIVNGQPVFCRGGNIGPQDAILARVSDAKYAALVAEAKNANFNMLRINGCSIYEAPAFYDACDHAGILVWQDFMLTCTTYPEQDPHFRAAVRTEAETIVPLLRHHASLALWCGNNECTWGFRDWWNPDKTRPLELGGVDLYNQVLPEVCRKLDPRRPYWVSSPAGGEEPNSELEGDCHWWWPFFMHADMERRIRHETVDECRARFASEYGIIGPCHIDSIREYLPAEEMHPGGLAWRMHTNQFETNTMAAAIRRHYADPDGLSVAEYSLYGQMFQAVMHGGAMEALRFRKHDPKDDCHGALIWAYSDCWGETGWSIIDYYLRRKASYYWLRRACAPVKVIVRRRGDRFVTRAVNDTLAQVACSIERGWYRLDGTARETESADFVLGANGMQEVGSAPVPPPSQRDPREWLYAAVMRDGDGVTVDLSIVILEPYRSLALARPDVRVNRLLGNVHELYSPVFAHAVHVDDHGRALVSDNWFDLLPGVPLRIQLSDGVDPGMLRFEPVVPA